jgi:hypothetical protein
MKRECWLIALWALVPLAGTAAQPVTSSAAAHAARHVAARPALATGHHSPARLAPATHSVPTRAALQLPAASGFRAAGPASSRSNLRTSLRSVVLPSRGTGVLAGATGSAQRQRLPANIALGGPSSFDARRLVRR